MRDEGDFLMLGKFFERISYYSSNDIKVVVQYYSFINIIFGLETKFARCNEAGKRL